MLLSTFANQKEHSSQSKGFKEEMAAKRNPPATTQNPDLIRGVGKYSRSKMYHHKRSLWAIKAEHGGISPRYDSNPKAPLTTEKAPKFYPADDVKKLLLNKRKPKPIKLKFFSEMIILCVVHVYGNRAADALANSGLSRNLGLHLFVVSPAALC
ncbi:hypothetical protein Gogos_008005 [Gossypium gossypioides]|uniref:Large ribosomal subunit protein uL6 N-terminal domain-containing protein n=1 Tax=Gossypium gossypioides TaxID=34282 RepID=A0A7J9CA81_GOSGO|nr:hypothetical protein [Gossypium gossypioides]